MINQFKVKWNDDLICFHSCLTLFNHDQLLYELLLSLTIPVNQPATSLIWYLQPNIFNLKK